MGVVPRNYFIAVKHFLFAKKVSKKYLYHILNNRGAFSENGKRVTQLNTIRLRCLKSGVPFDIGWRDLDWPTHCPILGMELARNDLASDKSSSPSIDRLVPELGYIKGNVRVVSKLANSMKSNATREQIEMFCKNVIPYMGGKL